MTSAPGGICRGPLSDPPNRIFTMSPTVLERPTTPSAEAANEAIRQYVADRRTWSQAELAELDRLRAIWRTAQERRN